jgi:undecaprenyl-diphosphatase
MTWLQAFIIAVVEGITEFLPISSTGHMIITQSVLGMTPTDFSKAFTVNIQFGAILSVVVLYWKRFVEPLQRPAIEGTSLQKLVHRFDFYLRLLVAFLPAAVLGLLLDKYIDEMLESVMVVAISLLVGGIVLLFVDKWFNKPAKNQEITYPSAFVIGLFQCISMIPGVSRSAATIIGGMYQKLSRTTAAEFSFFLAVPTMLAASAFKLLKNYESITADTLPILLFGNLVAFIVALLAIKAFIGFLTRYGFKAFGWYRIALGLAILIMLALGIPLNIA